MTTVAPVRLATIGAELPEDLQTLRFELWMIRRKGPGSGYVLTVEQAEALAAAPSEDLRVELLEAIEDVVGPGARKQVAARATRQSLADADEEGVLWTPALDAAAAVSYRQQLMIEPPAREVREVRALRSRLNELVDWARDNSAGPEDVAALFGFRSRAVFESLARGLDTWPRGLVQRFVAGAARRIPETSDGADVCLRLVDETPGLSRDALLAVVRDAPANSPLMVALAAHPSADAQVARALADHDDLPTLSGVSRKTLLGATCFQDDAEARRRLLERLSFEQLAWLLGQVIKGKVDLPLSEFFRIGEANFPALLANHFEASPWRWPEDLEGADLSPLLASSEPRLRRLALRWAEDVRRPDGPCAEGRGR